MDQANRPSDEPEDAPANYGLIEGQPTVAVRIVPVSADYGALVRCTDGSWIRAATSRDPESKVPMSRMQGACGGTAVREVDHIVDRARCAIDGASNDGLYSAQLFHGQIVGRQSHHGESDVVQRKRVTLGTF